MSERINIIARPNSSKTEITVYDKETHTYKVNVNAAPDKGKANAEIVKFFSKKFKKKARIVSGTTSRKKVLCIE